MNVDTTPPVTAVSAAPASEGAPRATEGATIEVTGVSKWFGDKVAVSDLSFALGPGVTALLGPNGAGKSTTLKMLTGLLQPSRGRIRVLGQSVFDNPPLYRRIGLVPEQEGIYPFLTAHEALRAVDLLDAAGRKIGGFSKGMRQRVKVAQALVHDPTILFLDEPLTGADPRQRLALMETFTRLGAAGKTVLISSHILYEVERMGSNVLVLINGKLAAEGDFHAIRALMDDRPRRVRVSCTDPRALAARLIALAGTRSLQVEDGAVVVETAAPVEFHHAVKRVARETGTRLYGIEGLDEDLESVFRYLVR